MRIFGFAGAALAIIFLCVGCGSKSSPTPAQPAEPATASAPQTPGVEDLKNHSVINASTLEEGKRLYHSTDCALCHGKDGDGKGFEARDAHMNVHDWRNAEYNKSFTDGKLYNIIANGKDRMPAYGTRNTPDQMWLMVDYIRSMSMTSPTR